MARKALGRGLDALIPRRVATVPGTGRPALAEIPVELIRPNPQQPREAFDEAAIESISASLRRHGMLQPVVVRKVAAGYELIAGERRWRGAQRAGLDRIPAVVRDASPQESLELALVENLQREDLNPIEEAHAYRQLTEEMGLTQEEAARRVGKDRSTVANYLRLLKLPPQVQALVVDGALSMGHARALLALEEPAVQADLAASVVAAGLSVRQTEARVRAAGRPRAQRSAGRRDPDVVAAEQKLTRALGAPVTIRGQERGRLEIRFESLDELNRLYDLLLEKRGLVVTNRRA